MLDTKDLGYEGKLELKKFSKGKIIGVVATVASALAVAATGIHLFNEYGATNAITVDVSLADSDFRLEPTFQSLNFQPALYLGGVNVGNLNRSERTALILSELEAERGRVFTATHGDHVVETTLGALGLSFDGDINATLDRLEEMEANMMSMSQAELRLPMIHDLSFTVSDEGISQWADQLAWQFDAPAVEPGLRMTRRGNFQVTEGQTGVGIDRERFVRDVTAAVNGSGNSVELVSTTLNPRFDESILANVDAVVASFSSRFETGISRARNVERGAEIINGHVIMPGEVFDYNSLFPTVFNSANGFAAGTVFVDGRPDTQYGGGLCQVSSTLFGAILRLGIVPSQWMPHSNRVHYVPGGLDACMWNEPGHPCNVIFTNPFDVPIYLTATTNNGTLNVEFWSTADALGAYSFQPTYNRTSQTATHDTYESFLRTYRNGNFVSQQHLITWTYIR